MSKTGSAAGRVASLACALLALCGSPNSHAQSLAPESSKPLIVAGVAVYLERDPPCKPTATDTITVTASPFKPQVNLGDLVTELARKAAAAHANTVYAIKLISFVPNEGAIATATISTCPQPDVPSRDNLSIFNPQLVDVVKRATDARAYLFAGGVPDRQRSVRTSLPEPQRFGGADAVAKLRQIIFSNDTYLRSVLGTKIENTCPFVANFGFEFRDGNGSSWWLVSETCNKATLVPPDQPWAEANTLNLTIESVAALRQLLSSPR
ncbi:hypothetical protein NLM27_42000 [Bradyrhizobium sp. CCGB12]|uniref:hypothetical protein n=1 Tax=Bradyrhizobium sp. CCGB12 TaxID=2949632 RepID=UPI0020B42BE6|nr:hypothetical protein [Bradyrhizobium sp. CCGB12]MCP3395309.1 hypothetical protein [Bradyrhizobium sp. CCGB12]